MPTQDLIDLTMNTAGCDAIKVALVGRLESYRQKMDRMEDVMRAGDLLLRKHSGKVIDLHTRHTLG